MHILSLLAQFQLTADGLALGVIAVAGLAINGFISYKAGAKGAGAYEERVANHGIKLQEHDKRFDSLDDDKRRQWEMLGEHGNDIAYIKGKIE